jgi:hypothetical protein
VVQDAALALKADDLPELFLIAKDEIFFFTFSPSQSGHLTLSVEKPIVRVSKGLPQSWQSNS